MTTTNNLSKFGASLNDNEVSSDFVRKTEKNVANGVAGLNASSKLPMAQLQTNVASGVPALTIETKVPNDLIDLGYFFTLNMHLGR